MTDFDQISMFEVPPIPPPADPADPADSAESQDDTAAAPSSAPVLVIVGPTASGKSSVAMQVARKRGDVELVAIDAFTVYRGMDLGTAKPSAEDRDEVPHHLVDVLDPSEVVAVPWFRDRARAAIADIHARGKVPLLVGGSGLYFRAVVDPLDFPPTDAGERARIEERWQDDVAGAHAHLTELDPAAAEKIEPDNLRRIVRALEVRAITGRAFSSFRTEWDGHASIYPGLHVARLDPDPDLLRKAIDARAATMVADGLVQECERLREQFGALSSTARQGIGYAEAFDVLDGKSQLEGLAGSISKRTRNYARRQRAWFRRDPRCGVQTPEQIIEQFTRVRNPAS